MPQNYLQFQLCKIQILLLASMRTAFWSAHTDKYTYLLSNAHPVLIEQKWNSLVKVDKNTFLIFITSTLIKFLCFHKLPRILCLSHLTAPGNLLSFIWKWHWMQNSPCINYKAFIHTALSIINPVSLFSEYQLKIISLFCPWVLLWKKSTEIHIFYQMCL